MNYTNPFPTCLSLQKIVDSRCGWRCNILTYPPIITALLKHMDKLRPIPPHAKAYYPKFTRGRGVGLFAARSFDNGETIIIERPTIIGARAIVGDMKILARLWEGFSGDELLHLSLLSNRHKEEATGQPWGFRILRTNGFGLPLPTPRLRPRELCAGAQDDMGMPEDTAWLHSTLFLDTSRLNHSCSPNAHTFWDENQVMLRVRAVKQIRAGDEITIAYGPIIAAQAERQTELLRDYGFKCSCVACRIPAKVSDSRRLRLGIEPVEKALFDRFVDAKRWTRSQVLRAQEECREILRLAEQEHLGAMLGVVAVRREWLAFTYLLLGDKENYEGRMNEAIREWESIENVGDPKDKTPLVALRACLSMFKRYGPSSISDWGVCAR